MHVHYYSGIDLIFNASTSSWVDLASTPIGKEDYKVLALAAAGHVWNDDTGGVLQARCAHEFFTTGDQAQIPGERLHLPLVHQALYGTLQASYPREFYECLLDHAQCLNSHGDDGNYIWSNGIGLVRHGYASGDPPSVETDNLSYLFYFNLFSSAYPDYVLGVSPYYINPYNLCENDIVKLGFTNTRGELFKESDQKTFIAGNSITAGGGSATEPYVIDNDNDPYQNPPFSTANINFMAKNLVHLEPGFEARDGVEFHAMINTDLNTIGCSGPTYVEPGTCEDLIAPWKSHTTGGSQTSSETYYDMLNRIGKLGSTSTPSTTVEDNAIQITPNPNNGSFQLNITKNEKPVGVKEVKVCDPMGKVIWEKGASTNAVFNIDISNSSSGIYYVKCVNEFGDVEVKKLIKN
jgi:hypothetical protein